MIQAGRAAIDFGRHTDDYAAHRPGPPAYFYDRLDALTPIRRSQALDLATGPGVVALELAARGGTVVGIDVAPEQIATAGRVARDRQLDGLARFRVAKAEDTGLGPAAFDLVTAVQCWHWFDRDAAMAEVRRVLRPGGVFALSHQRWRGRMRTCNGVGSGGLPPDEVVRFDEALAALLAAKHPDPLVVEHRVWCVVARQPA